MKITSLNLAGFKNWPQRQTLIQNYLNDTQADIVFFQEVRFNADISELNESKLINTHLLHPYKYSHTAISRIYTSSSGEETREGLSVLSKHPILESEILVLKKRENDKHTRIVQNVDILIGGYVQKFTNVHFSNNDYSDEQLEEVLTILNNRSEKRIILGDFNISDIRSVSNLYMDDYIDSFSKFNYISFPSEQATFDYVLLPRSYEFKDLSLGENLSDHNALTVDI